MPTNVETGITPLPDGGEVHWSREVMPAPATQP